MCLLEYLEKCLDESMKGTDCMETRSGSKTCEGFESLHGTDAENFSAIFRKWRSMKQDRKGLARKKKAPQNHKISATKTTYVITFMSALEFMRRNCVQKTYTRANHATANAPNIPPKRPSSSSRPKPPLHPQPNLRAQTQNTAKNAPTRRPFYTWPSSSTNKALIPDSAMRQVHGFSTLPPRTVFDKRRSRTPSVEIQQRRRTMQNQPITFHCRRKTNQRA